MKRRQLELRRQLQPNNHKKRAASRLFFMVIFCKARLINICQIDHLVLHRYGIIIIESKSVKTQIEINELGE